MRVHVSHLVVLPWLAACGGGIASSGSTNEDSTTSTSGTESSTQADGESTTGPDSESETGDPSDICESCSEDEVCVGDFNGFGRLFGGCAFACLPAPEMRCEAGECDVDCIREICGNSYCAEECQDEEVPGVDFWCDTGALTAYCSPTWQDCPEGEKCVAFASTGGPLLDAPKCVLVTGDKMIGEACMSGGIIEANDDCDENSMCYGVDDQMMGVCYGFCGLEETCPNGQSCVVANSGSTTLCMDDCVPHHAENCAAGTACTVNYDRFNCQPASSTLPLDSPCTPLDHCSPGQTCVMASELDGCASDRCCTDWCDTSMPDPCTQPETCQPYWPMAQAPMGLETAGVCKLP